MAALCAELAAQCEANATALAETARAVVDAGMEDAAVPVFEAAGATFDLAETCAAAAAALA